MKTTAAQIAEILEGEIEGRGDVELTGVAAVDNAEKGDIVLAEDERFFERALRSSAACIVTLRGVGRTTSGRTLVRVTDTAEAMIRLLRFFAGEEPLPPVGIGPGVVIGRDVQIGNGVAIGANCCIGAGTSLADGCVLFPNVYLGEAVSVGEHTKIYPNVTVYHNCTIGRRVIINAGVVIGADGFGYATTASGLVRYPHIGTVRIEDDVEIGANSTVDRAKTGATIIGSGTKIDNLVQIAHNVRVGRNCVIVALTGIAGSVQIGDSVTLAAQSGVKDHVRIGDGCTVAARGGVIGDLPDGAVVSGFPARDHAAEKRVEAARLHLPEIMRRLRALEKELETLRAGGQA